VGVQLVQLRRVEQDAPVDVRDQDALDVEVQAEDVPDEATELVEVLLVVVVVPAVGQALFGQLGEGERFLLDVPAQLRPLPQDEVDRVDHQGHHDHGSDREGRACLEALEPEGHGFGARGAVGAAR